MNDSPTLAADSNSPPDFMAALGILVILVLLFAYKAIGRWFDDAERKHDRGERLEAYRLRHSWKKSDIRNLLSLGVNLPAHRRMQRLGGTGRPIVKPHRAFAEEITEKLTAFQLLADPGASPAQRRKAVRQLPCWPDFVEALYRGEHELAKTQRIKNASAEIEITVGRALGISASTVHSICGSIRRKRKENPESADCPTMTIAECEHWINGQKNLIGVQLAE